MKRSLQLNPDHRPATWPQIRDQRDRHEVAPIETSFGLFDCDPRSEARMQGSIALFDSLPTLDAGGRLTWKLADNSYLPVTRAELESIYAQVQLNRATRGALLHVRAEQFAAMDPTPTVNELSGLAFWVT